MNEQEKQVMTEARVIGLKPTIVDVGKTPPEVTT